MKAQAVAVAQPLPNPNDELCSFLRPTGIVYSAEILTAGFILAVLTLIVIATL